MKRLLLCCLALWCWGGEPARAHDVSNSLVLLDFRREAVTAELVLSLSELAKATGLPLADGAGNPVEREGEALRNYLLARVRPVAPDGRAWRVAITDLQVSRAQVQPDLIVQLRMLPPDGAPLRRFTLNYGVICQEVPSHAALVSVRNDWNGAVFSGQPKLLGSVQYLATALPVDRTRGSFWQGFGSVLALGMRHIAGGADHLLFLFALLLPAPLRAEGNRWEAFRGLRGSFTQLLKIVTAFTIGHSLTLLIGALGWVRLPGRPVEVLIALSILVSALHALRPWFAGREPWVAGGFGLVHGLAFAGGVAQFGFSPWYLAMTILSFNLGIELMQFGLVAAMMPGLILLCRAGRYTPWRVAGAGLAATAAAVWMGERLWGMLYSRF